MRKRTEAGWVLSVPVCGADSAAQLHAAGLHPPFRIGDHPHRDPGYRRGHAPRPGRRRRSRRTGVTAEEDETSELEVRRLDPPHVVLLTRYEAEQLAGSKGIQRAFAMWGVRFGDTSLADCVHPVTRDQGYNGDGRVREDSGYAQVSVESVPEVVAGKVSVVVSSAYTSTDMHHHDRSCSKVTSYGTS